MDMNGFAMMNMNGFAMVFPLLAVLMLIGLPIALIVGKAGYSRWWAVLALIPMVNLLALWLFAFSPWPVLSGTVSHRRPNKPSNTQPDTPPNAPSSTP